MQDNRTRYPEIMMTLMAAFGGAVLSGAAAGAVVGLIRAARADNQQAGGGLFSWALGGGLVAGLVFGGFVVSDVAPFFLSGAPLPEDLLRITLVSVAIVGLIALIP